MANIFANNKLITVVASIAILGALWFGFSGSSPSPAILGTENAAGAVSDEDKDIVEKLLKLRSVTLSGTIFASKTFQGLKDFSTEITQEPVGRADPFAPLAAPSSQSASAVSGTANSSTASPFSLRQ
jgi:hypothetical protein